MNRFLRRCAMKILLIPVVKSLFERIWQFYERGRLENTERTELKRQIEFYEILRARNAKNIKQLDIKGEFPEKDAKALDQVVQMVLKDKVMVAEIGSWKGVSTSVLAKTIADYNGKVFAIDHWMGSEGVSHHDYAKMVDIYSVFKRNMIVLGVWDIIYPLVMDSHTASQIFADGILDLVFIDADHRYESVKKDILSWLPKIRDGGILCGHDCEGYYSQYVEEIKKMIDKHLHDDYITGICHPGVVKALHDCLQDRYSIIPDSVVWYYIKRPPSQPLKRTMVRQWQ